MRDDPGQSQTVKAILGLRGLIIDGEIKPGERVSELYVVDKIGVSRTPARMALVRLQEEGFLEALPAGGFAVSAFSESDVFDAVEIRGMLEGMAARLAAERGCAPSILDQMRKCVSELDEVVNNLIEGSELHDYIRLNDEFHSLLIESSQSTMIKRSLERVKSLPFAAPNAFVKSSRLDFPGVRTILIVSQDQHRSIVEAIGNREGARVQALTIEHSRSAWKYLRIAMNVRDPVDPVPGLSLVMKRGR